MQSEFRITRIEKAKKAVWSPCSRFTYYPEKVVYTKLFTCEKENLNLAVRNKLAKLKVGEYIVSNEWNDIRLTNLGENGIQIIEVAKREN